jgi:hypothetical protein
MRITGRIAVSAGALVVGLGVPVALTLYFSRAIHALYGRDLPFSAIKVALPVAHSAGILLSVSLWLLIVNRVWGWNSVRSIWASAIVLALMYGQWVAPCFVCLCGTGAMIFGIIHGFLTLLILRFLLALFSKDSPTGLLFYVPVMFGVPPYINHLVRSLTGHW